MKNAKLRTLCITIFTFFLVASGTSTPSNGASIFDLLPDGPGTTGYLGFTFEETRPTLGQLVSTISSNVIRKDKNDVPAMYLCTSMDDPQCTKG